MEAIYLGGSPLFESPVFNNPGRIEPASGEYLPNVHPPSTSSITPIISLSNKLFNDGMNYCNQSEYERAKACWKECAAILERELANALELAETYGKLGCVLQLQERRDESGHYYYKMKMTIHEQTAPGSPELADTYCGLNFVLYKQKQWDESIRYLKLACKRHLIRWILPISIKTLVVSWKIKMSGMNQFATIKWLWRFESKRHLIRWSWLAPTLDLVLSCGIKINGMRRGASTNWHLLLSIARHHKIRSALRSERC